MAEKGGVIIFEKGLACAEGHTEIDTIFKIFLAKHPEDAKKHMTDLVIPPWTKRQHELRARSFKFVPNEMTDFLLEIWEIKFNMILTKPTQ